MAISAVHYQLLKEHASLLKRGGALLEIGEANWYGDWDPGVLLDGLDQHDPFRHACDLRLGWVDESERPHREFQIAKAVYRVLFSPSLVTSVDMNGTHRAHPQDLNGPLHLTRNGYDTTINHGTAEHIFNIGMVFKSMHDYTKTGGIMIHEAPFTGWVDHGFYCLQPTLFYDLAAANEYEMVSLSVTHIDTRQIIRVRDREHCHDIADHIIKNSLLFVVLRKAVDAPFRIPLQAIYSNKLSEKGQENWRSLR